MLASQASKAAINSGSSWSSSHSPGVAARRPRIQWTRVLKLEQPTAPIGSALRFFRLYAALTRRLTLLYESGNKHQRCHKGRACSRAP